MYRLQDLLKTHISKVREELSTSGTSCAYEEPVNGVGWNLDDLRIKCTQLAELCSEKTKALEEARVAALKSREEKHASLRELQAIIELREKELQVLSQEMSRRKLATEKYAEKCSKVLFRA